MEKFYKNRNNKNEFQVEKNKREVSIKLVLSAFITLFLLVVLITTLTVCVLKNGEYNSSSIDICLNSGNNQRNLSNYTLVDRNTQNGFYDVEKSTFEGKVYPQKAKSGIVIEQSSKRVLLDENMNERCFPASTTKVLTAITVIENCDIKKVVKIRREAVGVEGSSIYLKVNHKYSIHDLLKGLMLRSGNDAATQLAYEVSGNIEKFAELMNATAKKCGAENSNFINPHGLHDENHYTTAYDLAMICAYAFENPVFRDLCDMKIATLNYIDENNEPCKLVIGNKNKLLRMYDGANGVKTGYTKKSGRCLVGSAKKDGMQLISVVLNYNDMWNDTIRLLNYGYENYFMCPIEKAKLYGQSGTEIKVKIHYDSAAQFNPKAYPIKRDNTEKLTPVFV